MYEHLIELTRQDDSNKRSNIGFGEEITQVELVEVQFKHLELWHVLTQIAVLPAERGHVIYIVCLKPS